MNDLTEKLWPAFRAEIVEQIEALELSLVEKPEDIRVNEVFRYMHTIKGGCAMMGFAAMQSLAHAAEDFLDRVRKGEVFLDNGNVDVLLAAVDALKQQLQEVETTRRDPMPQTTLVERLRHLVEDKPARSPEAVSAVRAIKPVRPKENTAVEQRASGTRPQNSFAEVARQLLPELALAAVGPERLDGSRYEPLLAAATANGLQALVLRFAQLVRAGDVRERHGLLADMMDRIRYLETESGSDCGTAAAAAALRPVLLAAWSNAAFDLFDSLPLLDSARQAPSRQDCVAALQQFAAAIQRFRELAQLLQLDHTLRLMRLTAQLLRDVMRDMLSLGPELAEVLGVVAGLPSELENGVEDAPYAAMASQIIGRLQDIARACGRDAGRESRLAALKERLHLDYALLDALTSQSLDGLEAAVRDGHSVMEIEADLEAAPDHGEAFVAWISSSGHIIHSATVFRGGVGREEQNTLLRFLIAFPLSEDEVRRQLGGLDPGRQWYRLLVEDDAGQAAEVKAIPRHDSTTAPVTHAGATLRIDSGILDQFVSRVGEMVMLRNMQSHTLRDDELLARLRRLRTMTAERAATLSPDDVRAVGLLLGDLEARLGDLEQADVRMQGALGRLQEDVLGLRVVPVGVVFNRLPRVVRDLSHAQHKQVGFEITGEDVRIDKGMVDILIEPLMHMVRNSVDHGIETPAERQGSGKPVQARLQLRARQQGNTLIIDIRDDGRGLDRDRIRQKAIAAGLIPDVQADSLSDRELYNLIFLPGFSTSDQVTEVSGRGVGMDVVKTRVAQVGGQVEVESMPGEGTCFTLRLPLSAAIQSVVMVASGDRQYALPERNVMEVISVPCTAMQRIQGQTACLLRGVTLPLYHLGVLLGGPEPLAPPSGNVLEVVVLSDGVYRIGVMVDRVLGRPEVFLRDMHPDIARLPGIGGVSILGNGGVLIILDCERLFALAVRNAQSLRNLLSVS